MTGLIKRVLPVKLEICRWLNASPFLQFCSWGTQQRRTPLNVMFHLKTRFLEWCFSFISNFQKKIINASPNSFWLWCYTHKNEEDPVPLALNFTLVFMAKQAPLSPVKKLFFFSSGILETFITVGIIFGWTPLLSILVSEGQFAELCPGNFFINCNHFILWFLYNITCNTSLIITQLQ